MQRRPNGFGTITELPDGRFWVRGPRQPDGTRPSIAYCASEEDAERELARGLHYAAKAKRVPQGQTFAEFARDVLDEREHNGIRGIRAERLRFKKHLATACFADKLITTIVPSDIAEWLRAMAKKKADDKRGDRLLSASTQRRALSLASVIFDEANPQGRGLIETNPCAEMEVKVRHREVDEDLEDPWTWLRKEEMVLLATSSALSEWYRNRIMFAIGTGLRAGEQFNLHLPDVHVTGLNPHVTVRFGSKGKPPKNGKIREVPLFGYGLEAARAQLAAVQGQPNDHGLLFPAIRGGRQGQKVLGNGLFLPGPDPTHVLVSGKARAARPDETATHRYVDRFKYVRGLVGITRDMRWHDLRHTFASALVQGLWGPAQKLEVVRELCGHSSIIVTQRYAHLGDTAVKNAVKDLGHGIGYGLVGGGRGVADPVAAIVNEFAAVGSPGLEPGTYGLKGADLAEALRLFTAQNGPNNQLATQLASTLVSLLEARS